MQHLNENIPVEGGQMGAYLATPASGTGPGIVILQEIFGVNDAMRAAADDFAAQGYTVLVPDLFWRLKPGIELGYSEDERKEAFGHMTAFNFGSGIADVMASMDYLKAHPACSGEVAVMGYCLGGKLAVVAGAKGSAKAIVSFYGVKLEEDPALLASLPKPLQIHVGSQDTHIPMEAIEKIEAAVSENDQASVFVYDGAQHGFYNRLRADVFDSAASGVATEHVLAFLKQNIG